VARAERIGTVAGIGRGQSDRLSPRAVNPGRETLEELLALPDEEAVEIVRAMSGAAALRFHADWPAWVREGQSPPEGAAWRVWVMLAGRGFGKTKAGAEWISALARDHPGARIALVAANIHEARKLMVEGKSGLLAAARPGREAEQLRWEPSLRRLTFASGAEAYLYSGADADSLRGDGHHFAWCDEVAKWRQAQEAWDNLMLSLREGENPRVLVTTTPRPIAALKAILGGGATERSGGATRDNPHLAEPFVADMERRIGGTRLGRQELEGELIEDLEGALWSRDLIEAQRKGYPLPAEVQLRRIVIGVDPPASVEGTCGIVVCGADSADLAYVLGDHSAAGLSPEGWARRVAATAEAWGAHRVVAESNQGGAMVQAVLRGANVGLPVKLVRAADGKSARAAPVATLFESRRAWFGGRFPELEEQLCGLTWEGAYHGPGTSPDRADAMVWALTELMLGPKRAEPRIRIL
jgi:phage terminase large subunit-like protein